MRDRKGMNGSGWEGRRGQTGRRVEVKKIVIGIYSVRKESILNKREKKKTYPKSLIFKKKQILNY